MAKKITAKPSVITMKGGVEKELNSCSQKERENWRNKSCKLIGTAISEHYADRIQEWNIFAKKMVS